MMVRLISLFFQWRADATALPNKCTVLPAVFSLRANSKSSMSGRSGNILLLTIGRLLKNCT